MTDEQTAKPWPWECNSDVNPWWPETQYMVGWFFADTCRARCEYCFVYQKVMRQVAEGKRWWSDEQAVEAWRNLAADYGPGHIIFSGLEPSEQLPLVSAVLEYHYGAMLTNLDFDVDEFRRLIPPDRCRIHPSFQPHLWGMEAQPFVKKLLALQAEGYFVLMATIVGYPPYLSKMDDWVSKIEAAGFRAVVLPFQMPDYNGKRYPEGYTQDEWAIVRRKAPQLLKESGRAPKEKLTACGAGFACAYVQMSGSIWRCGQVPGMGDQNLMRDGTIKWIDEPKPCPRENCPCTQFHIYHIKESANDE